MKWEIEKRTKEVFNMGGVCKHIRDAKRGSKYAVNVPLKGS